MKHKQAFELTGQQVHDAMLAAGFLPLLTLRHAIHWVRDGRHAVTYYDQLAEEAEVSKLTPITAAHVSFTQTQSGEVIAHARQRSERRRPRAQGRQSPREQRPNGAYDAEAAERARRCDGSSQSR